MALAQNRLPNRVGVRTAVDSDPVVAAAMALQQSAEQMKAILRVEAERKAAKEKPCRIKK